MLNSLDPAKLALEVVFMPKQFAVRGVNPLGRIVEMVVVADSAAQAKAKAEDTGLQFVVAREANEPRAPESGPGPSTEESLR